MSVLTQSWRRSLAVTMVAALLGPASTSAIAAGPTDGEEDEKKVDVEIELVQSDDLDEERPTIRRYTTEAPSDVGRVERGKFRFVPNSADVVIEGDEVRRVERTERPDGGRDGRLRERVEVRERRSDDLAGDRDGPESVPGIRWRTRISQLGSEARKQQRAVVQESVRGIRAQLEELQGRESKEAHRIRVSLQTEIKELQRHLAELQKQSSANPEDRRVQHLEAAAANLHAAGLHEQAEYLEREARRIASSEAKENEPRDVLVPRRIRRGEERLGADFTRPLALRPTRELLPPMAGADEVARLRNEVESVRDEMHEMRAMLERLLKRRDAHEEERLLERRDAHEEERLLERRDAHEEEEVEIEYRERDHDDETRHGEHDEEDHEDEEDD